MSAYQKHLMNVIQKEEKQLEIDVEENKKGLILLERANQKLTARYNKMKSEQEASDAKIQNLEEQLSEKKSKVTELTRENEALKSQINDLELQLAIQNPAKSEGEGSSSRITESIQDWKLKSEPEASEDKPGSRKKRGRPTGSAKRRNKKKSAAAGVSSEDEKEKSETSVEVDNEDDDDEEEDEEGVFVESANASRDELDAEEEAESGAAMAVEEGGGSASASVSNQESDNPPFEGYTRSSNRSIKVDYTKEPPLSVPKSKVTEGGGSHSSAASGGSRSSSADKPAKEQKITQRRHSTGSSAVTTTTAVGNRSSGGGGSSSSGSGDLVTHCRELGAATNQDTLLRLVNRMLQRMIKGHPSIDVLLHEKVDMKLVSLFHVNDNEELLHRALIVFNNLIARTMPEQFNTVLTRNKFIHTLVQLVNHPSSAGVQEQAVWILDNIAIDGNQYRKRCVEAGMLAALLKCLDSSKNKQVLLIGTKALSTLTVGAFYKLPHSRTAIESILTSLRSLLASALTGQKQQQQSLPVEVITNCCNAVYNVTLDEDNEVIQMVLQQHQQQTDQPQQQLQMPTLPQSLVKCLGVSSPAVKLQAVNAVANLAAGPPSSHNTPISLLQWRLLPALKHLLSSEGGQILAGACRCVANIAAGNEHDLQSVIDADLFPTMIRLALGSKHESTRLYAAYSIVYAFHGASLLQTQYLVDQDALKVAFKVVDPDNQVNTEDALVLEALRGLRTLLKKFDYISDFEYVSDLVEELDGWVTLRECAKAYESSGVREDMRGVWEKISKIAEALTKENLLTYYRARPGGRAGEGEAEEAAEGGGRAEGSSSGSAASEIK